MTVLQKAVFLDRDGVLNKTKALNGKPYAPKFFNDFFLYECAAEQLYRLKERNFKLIVVTNQPDVGNGITESSEVDKMHKFITDNLPIDLIKTCFHSQTFGCSCRKPSPGMFFQAARELRVSALESFMIGDRYSDIKAGNSFGCRSILIDRYYLEDAIASPWRVSKSLTESVTAILSVN